MLIHCDRDLRSWQTPYNGLLRYFTRLDQDQSYQPILLPWLAEFFMVDMLAFRDIFDRTTI